MFKSFPIRATFSQPVYIQWCAEVRWCSVPTPSACIKMSRTHSTPQAYWEHGASNHTSIDQLELWKYSQHYAGPLHFPRTFSFVPILGWVQMGAQVNFLAQFSSEVKLSPCPGCVSWWLQLSIWIFTWGHLLDLKASHQLSFNAIFIGCPPHPLNIVHLVHGA